MERSPTLIISFLIPLFMVSCFFFSSLSLVQPRELRRKAVCGDDILFLDCGNESIVTIHEAAFSSDVMLPENVTCPTSDYSSEPRVNGTCAEDVRNAINKRCSGLRECNFSYAELAERKCDMRWGSLVVEYDCAKESSISKYCNVRIHSKEGYVTSPGYPMYYPGLRNCSWAFEAGDGQIITLRLLHMHLRLPRQRNDQEFCDDAMTIMEGNTRRLRVCGEGPLQTLEVEANNGLVIQFTSNEFYPASGFLLHYKVKGCSTLLPPAEGYLVQRNGSLAFYACCEKYRFNDTQETSRTLQCIGEHRWNDSMVSCVQVAEVGQVYVNQSLDMDFENVTDDKMVPKISEAQSSYMEDILIPSILMSALVLGNAVIVIIILRIRKKQKSKVELEDEDLRLQMPLPVTGEATEV